MKRTISRWLALVYTLTNVFRVYAGETNYWEERRQAVQRRSSPTRLASFNVPRSAELVATGPSASLQTQLPGQLMPASHRALLPGMEKDWGWLPELVANYGDIREIHVASRPDAPVVIHLQDVHDLEEAQKNLAGLVESLRAKRGISLVGLEGALGSFELDFFREGPLDVRKKLSDRFLNLGYLTGPEVAGIIAEKPPTLWGIEDVELYRGHVEAFEQSESGRAQVRQFLTALTVEADKARETFYSPALRALDDHRRAYMSHQKSLGDYVPALWSAQKGVKKAYPQVALLVKLLAQEQTLDFKEVERQRVRLAEVLAQRLSPEELDRLVKASMAYRSGRQTAGAYQKYLANVCRHNNIRLDTFGPLASYMDYVQVADPLDSGKLLDELDRLELAALTGTAETNEEKKLVNVFRGLALVDKLTNHGLTPQEWRVLKKEDLSLEHIRSVLTQISPTSVSKTVSLPDLSPYKEFCLKAEQRNNALVKNLLAKIKTDKVNSAVLVAGGFHTEGMTALLKEANASYVVITPKISKVPDTRPLDIFVRAPLPLEKLLAGDVIHLAYPRLTQQSSDAMAAANNAIERKETLYQAWKSGLAGGSAINGNKRGVAFFQQLNQRVRSALAVSRLNSLMKELPFFMPPVLGVRVAEFLTSGLGPMGGLAFHVLGGVTAAILFWPTFLRHHARAEAQWTRDNPGKTPSDYRRKLLLAYGLIGLATIGAMILSPEIGVLLSQIQGPSVVPGEMGRVLQSIVFGGLIFHGFYNFLGRLAGGPAFVPAMAKIVDSNDGRYGESYSETLGEEVLSMMAPFLSPSSSSRPEDPLVTSLLIKIKNLPDNDVLWKKILLQTDSLLRKLQRQVLAVAFEGAENFPRRMKSLFEWCESKINPDHFNANKTFMEDFFRSVLKSNEGKEELSRRIPRLLELLMGLVRERSYFEILPALKMMDQLLEASPQLEHRGGRPVGELLRSSLTEILSQERFSPVHDDTHFFALLRLSRRAGVDPTLCSDVTLRRLAAADWFKETFINEIRSGRMGSDEAEWFIGKDPESILAGISESPDSFLSSPEAKARVSQVLAVVRGEKEWEQPVDDFHRATDPAERMGSARRLEGLFSNALDLLRAVHRDQREAVEALAKLVPSLSRMKPVGFSTSLFLSGDSLLRVVSNLTSLGHLLNRDITDEWNVLDQIRPIIPLEPGASQVEVLGYTFPSILGTWMREESLEVRPARKTRSHFAVISADPTMLPDQEIQVKAAARKRLLAIDEKGRSRFAGLAGSPMTRRDAESLLFLVEQMHDVFKVLERKKSSPSPASTPVWESLKRAIKNGVDSLGAEEIIPASLQHKILDLPRPARQWDDVGTLHQALNYMHQEGKELFNAAAKEAKVNASVKVDDMTMSVANLSGNPLESRGIILSRELRQFLRALEKPGIGPNGSLVLDEEFFKGSIPLGVHSVDFLASIAPPEKGGGIKLSFLEWRPKEGNTLRLEFIRAVMDKLGFKTGVKEGMYLDATLDIHTGAASQEQIEKALFLVVRALYHTPDLNLMFDHVIEAKRQEEGLDMAEAYAATRRDFADLADVFLAEEALPFFRSGDRLDHAYRIYKAREAERNRLRGLLNERLSRCGLSPIPGTLRFGQGVIQSYYTEPLLSAVARGEVLFENKGPVRNPLYRPVDELAKEALSSPDELMGMAAGLRTLTVETVFRPIGAVGKLTAGECQWTLGDGEQLVLRGLSDPEAERLLYATATLFTNDGTSRRLTLEQLASLFRTQGLAMDSGEEMRGPLRALTEKMLRAQPRKEALPGLVHRGSGSSSGTGGTIAGVVTFDREFYEKSGARTDHILVVDYTTPSDFDAMKSALATVTLLGNPETHSSITLRELHHPGVILRGARWVTVEGERRLSVPVLRPQEPRLGTEGLWITSGMDVEEQRVGPGSVLLVNGERGVVSILSGKGVSEVYQKWRELAEHRAPAEEVVACVVSFRDWEVLEFVLFLSIFDSGLSEPERTHFISLLETSVAGMRPEDQQRFYATKIRYLGSVVERTDKDLVWLVDMFRWANTFMQISASFYQIQERIASLEHLAKNLSLSNPRSSDLSGLTKEAKVRGKRLLRKSLREIFKWSRKSVGPADLPALRQVLRQAELNGVPLNNRDFQRLAKKGRVLADEKRKRIRKEKAWVYRLDKVNRDYTREVGGKFANLGESEPLIRQEGAFVPRALAVTSDAFDVFHLEQGIKAEHDELADELDYLYTQRSLSDSEIYGQVQMKSQQMRDLIERYSIDGERALGKKILSELDAAGLGNVALILRSTGDMEDSGNAAFAGGARSFSNVSRENVLKILPKVEASFWLSRGVAYRAYQGMKQKNVHLAAMIQELINGEISGVMLTVNPTTGEDSVVITAGYGLNEGIEKNLVECDEYTVRKSDGELIAHPKIPQKPKKLIPNPTGEGTVLVDVPLEDQKRQVLSAEQIKWLVRVGNALQNHYDTPRNVEYAFVGGKLAILQDRAVTTLSVGLSPSSAKGQKSGGSWKSSFAIGGLLFILSFGLAGYNRQANAFEYFSPSSPIEEAYGAVSFATHPDREEAKEKLIKDVTSLLPAVAGGPTERDAVNNIAAALHDSVLLDPSLAVDLASQVVNASAQNPWLTDYARLILMKGNPGEGSLPGVTELVRRAEKMFVGFPAPVAGVSVLDAWVLVLNAFEKLLPALSNESQREGFVALHGLAHRLVEDGSVDNGPAHLFFNRTGGQWLTRDHAQEIRGSKDVPEWLRVIAAKKIARDEEETSNGSEPSVADSPALVFLKNLNSSNKADLWVDVQEWAREILLGTKGTLDNRVFALTPLEAYVLLEAMSQPDRTIPVDHSTAARVCAQLWEKITIGLKAEFDQGPDPKDTSLYGPLSNLVVHGDGFGQKAFYDYAIESGQWTNLVSIVPSPLKTHVMTAVRKVSPVLSSSAGALFPVIGRPVNNLLQTSDATNRWSTGIARFAKQSLLGISAPNLAWLANGVIFLVGSLFSLGDISQTTKQPYDPNRPISWGHGSDHPGSAVVIGDADASFGAVKKILTSEGLVDEKDRWVGGRRVVVQVGDVVGRGQEPKELYEYLINIQAQARKAGGNLVLLLGNHEMALLMGQPIGGDFKENQTSVRDELRELLAQWVKNGNIQCAAVLANPKGEKYFVTHAGYSIKLRNLLPGLPVWQEWLESESPQTSGTAPHEDVLIVQKFLNQAVVEIADEIILNPRGDLNKKFRQYLNRSNGILLGSEAVLNRVAKFVDEGFFPIRQIIGHSVTSSVRFQDKDNNVINTDSGLYHPDSQPGRSPMYLRLTGRGAVRAVEVGRFGERRSYRLTNGYNRPRPLNAWGWAAEIKDWMTLKLFPIYWLRLHVDHASTLEEMLASYHRFYTVLGRGRLPWHRRSRPEQWLESHRLVVNKLWEDRASWRFVQLDGGENDFEAIVSNENRFDDLLDRARDVWKTIPGVAKGEVLPAFLASRNYQLYPVQEDAKGQLDLALQHSPVAVSFSRNRGFSGSTRY
jgi:hypothetical protein